MALYSSRMLSLLLMAWQAAMCAALRIADRATIVENAASVKAAYDYVIVGGGTSGLTVAYRLTEDPSSKLTILQEESLL